MTPHLLKPGTPLTVTQPGEKYPQKALLLCCLNPHMVTEWELGGGGSEKAPRNASCEPGVTAPTGQAGWGRGTCPLPLL